MQPDAEARASRIGFSAWGCARRGGVRGAPFAFGDEGAEHESGDQPKVHEEDGDRFDPRQARHLPEGVGGDGADGREDPQHAGLQPHPSINQDEHRAGEFNEGAQERLVSWCRYTIEILLWWTALETGKKGTRPPPNRLRLT